MKSNQIRLNLLIILLPLIVIFFVGGYMAYITWDKYTNTSELQHRLNKIGLLQSLEQSIYNEIICTTKISSNRDELKDQCVESRRETDLAIQRLGEQSTKVELYHKINSFFYGTKQTTEDKTSIFGKKKLSKIIQDIRYNIDTTQNLKLNTLINSAYHEKILNPIKRYWETIGEYSDESNRPFLNFFMRMNDIYINSATETIYSTYFLSNKKNFSPIDLAQWDEYLALSMIPNIDNYQDIEPIKAGLLNIFDSDSTNKIISKIDETSISILLGYSTGRYEVTPEEWILLNRKKQDLFIRAERETLHYLINKNQSTIKKYEIIIISSIIFSILSMIIFIFATKNYLKKIKEEDDALKKMMKEIEILNAESKREVLSSDNLLGDLSDKKQIYIYIGSIMKLLHEKELQAEEANYAKDLFLANMSHEIRTPLNGIVGFTQLLKESPLTSDQQDFINIIENSSDNLLTIVNDILDLSKITAKKMELEYVSFDIFEKTESAIGTFAAKADEREIELGISVDPNLPKYLIGDPAKLTQVLINLISNALKFTDRSGEVNLFVEKVADEDSDSNFETIRFSIKDSGIGISKEQKEKIFQAFTQADSSTSRKFGGTGLGLTISQAIIEYMGGKLDVTSKEGEGAEFFFTISLERDIKSKGYQTPNYKNLTIGLALPDANILRQVDYNLKRYIERLGADFKLYSYSDLFDKSREESLPDILFIDSKYLKDSNELKLFANIDSYIILMTTGSFKNILVESDHSFLKIIHKPITINKAEKAIDGYLSKENVATPQKETTIHREDFKNIHALVAEDNIINQKLILATLENFGLRVTLTSNGKEALEKRQRDDYDIIFMDIQMPVMNGVEATKAILEYEKEYNIPHIPIIALTANALKGDREKYIESGMDNYVSKPLDLTELEDIIGYYFSNSSSDSDKENIEDIEQIEDLVDADEDNIARKIEDPTDSNKDNIEIEEDRSQIASDEMEEKRRFDSSEIDILLYNKIALQSNIYRSIFRGLGYSVEIVRSDDEFLDALENKSYTHAMYDADSFNDMACSVADIAKDAGAIPIMFIEDDTKHEICTPILKTDSSREVIKDLLEGN